MSATSSRSRLLARLVLIAALGATLGLAACGRKGPLDMPPGAAASAADSQPAAQPAAGATGAAATAVAEPAPSPIGVGPDGRAIPRGPRKPLPMDVLLN